MEKLNLPSLINRAVDDDPETASPATQTLFRDVIEPMCDSFELKKRDAYVELFLWILERLALQLDSDALRARYERVREPEPVPDDYRDVVVLSRVTLGADIAVTSVLLDAARRRFPHARLHFAGPRKNFELFEGEQRLTHISVPYGRTSLLRDRVQTAFELEKVLSQFDRALILDPDSRLTQLGLLPVCEESRYRLFESRAYHAESSAPLGQLAADWCGEVLGVGDARPWIAPVSQPVEMAEGTVTMSVGVGENPAKRPLDPFEEQFVESLTTSGTPLLIDEGMGGEESERAQRLAARFGVRTFRGPFATFAATISASAAYIGYDSAGQHAAAACGTPLLTVFAGFVNERMASRWTPHGSGRIHVVRLAKGDDALEKVLAAWRRLFDPNQD